MELYTENKKVYLRVQDLFKLNNKVGLYQSPGSGKSCIGVKWIEDNLESNFLIVYISEATIYSYTKHCKNNNVFYLTYSKLCQMSKSEIDTFLSENNINKVIFDEFHHSGAEKWQIGVEFILDYCDRKSCLVLALTATPIRFLDNARNMFKELNFKIVEGMQIEDMLKHCGGISYNVLHYLSDTQSYADKILRMNLSSIEREHQLNSLTVLNQQNMNSDLPNFIHNFLNEKVSHLPVQKYVAFYNNKEELVVNQFLEKILCKHGDLSVYTLSSDNNIVASLDTLNKFNTATKGIHLLKCINKVNEGLHPEGLTGLFFFRKTVSPNVFIQQLGRGLEINNPNKVYIFDLVSNIEELENYKDTQYIFSKDFHFTVRNSHIIDDVSDSSELNVTIIDLPINKFLVELKKKCNSSELSDSEKGRIDFLYELLKDRDNFNIAKNIAEKISKPYPLVLAYLNEKYQYEEKELKIRDKKLKLIDKKLIKRCPLEGIGFIKNSNLSVSDKRYQINRAKELGVDRHMKINRNDIRMLANVADQKGVLEVYKDFPQYHPLVILQNLFNIGYAKQDPQIKSILLKNKKYWNDEYVNDIYRI